MDGENIFPLYAFSTDGCFDERFRAEIDSKLNDYIANYQWDNDVLNVTYNVSFSELK